MNDIRVKSLTDWRSLHGLVLIAAVVATAFVPASKVWPLPWLLPLSAYFLFVAIIPPLRNTFPRLRVGGISASTVGATIAISAGAAAALAIFQWTMHPDLSVATTFIPVRKFGGILAAGVVFSTFNAVFEEVIFRGILFESIVAEWNVGIASGATAIIFGYLHMHGYPSGALGACLAGIYGLALAWLRLCSGGIALPVASHIVADATIFTILVHSGAV